MNDYIVLFYDFLLHSPYKRYGSIRNATLQKVVCSLCSSQRSDGKEKLE